MTMYKNIVIGISGCIVLGVFFLGMKEPSNDRQWMPDQTYLPHVSIDEDTVTIDYVRDFVYTSTDEYIERYRSLQVNTNDIVSVEYLVEPFGEFQGPAHTLLTFGFKTNSGIEYIAVSVEIRKEEGESFSAIKGLFRSYELMYVVGTEEDLIKLRTNHRQDDVYLYPIKTTPERMKTMFVSLMNRVQDIEEQPEFYNTITNNCTSNIRLHVNEIVPGRVPWTFSIILPASSDKLAYELGLIDTDISFEETRERFYITDIANRWGEGQHFSTLIRSGRNEG